MLESSRRLIDQMPDKAFGSGLLCMRILGFKSMYLMIRMYLRDSKNVPRILLRSLYRVRERQSSRELHLARYNQPYSSGLCQVVFQSGVQTLAFSLLVALALQWVTGGQLGVWWGNATGWFSHSPPHFHILYQHLHTSVVTTHTLPVYTESVIQKACQ